MRMLASRQVVIFVKSVSRARELNKLLNECNFPSVSIYRGMDQTERIKVGVVALCVSMGMQGLRVGGRGGSWTLYQLCCALIATRRLGHSRCMCAWPMCAAGPRVHSLLLSIQLQLQHCVCTASMTTCHLILSLARCRVQQAG